MQIGAADRAGADPDQYLSRAGTQCRHLAGGERLSGYGQELRAHRLGSPAPSLNPALTKARSRCESRASPSTKSQMGWWAPAFAGTALLKCANRAFPVGFSGP